MQMAGTWRAFVTAHGGTEVVYRECWVATESARRFTRRSRREKPRAVHLHKLRALSLSDNSDDAMSRNRVQIHARTIHPDARRAPASARSQCQGNSACAQVSPVRSPIAVKHTRCKHIHPNHWLLLLHSMSLSSRAMQQRDDRDTQAEHSEVQHPINSEAQSTP